MKFALFCHLVLLQLPTFSLAWTPGNDRQDKGFSLSRRHVNQQVILGGLFGGILLPTDAAQAGEVGARINAAVTKSDLGISVRRSVVQGAQIMDGIDGQWEKFSDRFGLGSNRARQPDRPLPKQIPPSQPLDGALASKLLELSDEVFVSLTKISFNELDKHIDKVTFTVAPSFERSGLDIEDIDAKNPRNGEEFNFLCYTHYKAFTDLILEEKIDFPEFQRQFEEQMGLRVAQLILPKEVTSPRLSPGNLSDPKVRQGRWKTAEDSLQRVNNALVQRGLVAQIDISYDKDDLTDWLDDAMSDLQFNVALDRDVTLSTQILLQEQGFRLYPNFGRYAIRSVLEANLGTAIDITDYYMDTDYNSDPDKFEVKEVLLSIILETD